MLTLLIQNIINITLPSLSTICSCSQLRVDLWRHIPAHQVNFADMESLSHRYFYVCSNRATPQLWSEGHSLGLNSLIQKSPRLLGTIKKLLGSCAQSRRGTFAHSISLLGLGSLLENQGGRAGGQRGRDKHRVQATENQVDFACEHDVTRYGKKKL